MSIWDYLILAGLGIAVFFVIRSIKKRRKKGGCAGCGGDCSACNPYSPKKQDHGQNSSTSKDARK